jgi:hypothetical protein
MPRTSRSASLDDIIREAVAPVIERASAAIAKAVAELTAERVPREAVSFRSKSKALRRARVKGRRPRRNVEMTEWTADRRARRVPTFVIEATGLDTKKKIVAKFGEGVTFHKGKPLPTPKTAMEDKTGAAVAAKTERQVKAKPPRVRKAAIA